MGLGTICDVTNKYEAISRINGREVTKKHILHMAGIGQGLPTTSSRKIEILKNGLELCLVVAAVSSYDTPPNTCQFLGPESTPFGSSSSKTKKWKNLRLRSIASRYGPKISMGKTQK